MTTTQLTAQEIIASLPIRQRPTLTIGQGNLLLDYDEQGSAAIIGSVVQDGDAHYLGCMSCKQEIEESDGGMCPGCRSDFAYSEAIAGHDA